MKLGAVMSASKQFLKTRDGFDAAPSIRGLIRSVEATVVLHQAFVPEGTESRRARMAFRVWRVVLLAVSETDLLVKKAARLWRML